MDEFLYVNVKTKEVRYFPHSYEEGLPVGGPEDAEGNPEWQPYGDRNAS